jgi:hypothetical protein
LVDRVSAGTRLAALADLLVAGEGGYRERKLRSVRPAVKHLAVVIITFM